MMQGLQPTNALIDEVCIDTNTNPAREHRIRAVPTLLILDDDGKEIARASKFQSQESLIEFLTNNAIEF